MATLEVQYLIDVLHSFPKAEVEVQWSIVSVLVQNASAASSPSARVVRFYEEAEALFFNAAKSCTDNEFVARAGALLSLLAPPFISLDDLTSALQVLLDCFTCRAVDFRYSTHQGLVMCLLLRDLVQLLRRESCDAFRGCVYHWLESLKSDLSNNLEDNTHRELNLWLWVKLCGELLSSFSMTGGHIKRQADEMAGLDLAAECVCERLTDVVMGCILDTSKYRSLIIKSLLSPLIGIVAASGVGDAHAALSRMWMVASCDLASDAPSASLVASIMMQGSFVAGLVLQRNESNTCSHMSPFLFHQFNFWDTIIAFFLNDDIIVRKRGAYLTEQFLASFDNKYYTSRNSTAPEGATKSVNRHRKGRNGQVQTQLQREPLTAAAVIPVADHHEHDEAPQRHWLYDFLSIYGQIEGCRYIHLVEQVLGHFGKMCAMLYQSSCDGISSTDVAIAQLYPELDFRWIQIIIQCLFRSQLMAIRKHALHSIFSGTLHFRISPLSIDWVVTELLHAVDAPLYFPSHFTGPENGLKVDISDEYPGRMLPAFLSNLFQECARPENCSMLLMPRLVRGIVRAVCGPRRNNSSLGSDNHYGQVESLTTCKWIFSVFAFPSVQQQLMDAPGCLPLEDVLALRSFLQDRVMTVNDVIWNQMFSGVLPLLLCGVVPAALGPCLSSPRNNCSVDILGVIWGFNMWHRSVVFQYPIIRRALRQWALQLSVDSVSSDGIWDMEPQEALELAFAICVLCEWPSNLIKPGESVLGSLQGIPSVCIVASTFLEQTGRLYGAPYMSHLTQSCIVRFVHGIFLGLHLTVPCEGTSEGTFEIHTFSERTVIYWASHNVLTDLALYFSLTMRATLGSGLRCYDGADSLTSTNELEWLITCSAVFSEMISISCVRLLATDETSPLFSEINNVIDCGIKLLDEITSFIEQQNLSIVVLPALQCCLALVSALSTTFCDFTLMLNLSRFSSMFRLGQMVLLIGVPLVQQFRAEVSNVHVSEGCSRALLADVAYSCSGLFGKYASQFISIKWSLLKFIIPIIVLGANVEITPHTASETFLVDILAAIQESVDYFPLTAVPAAISCCQYVVQSVLHHADGVQTASSKENIDLIAKILTACWKACLNDDSLFTASIFTFVKLAFQPALLSRCADLSLMNYFWQLMDMGTNRRPHILQNLILHLFFVWKVTPILCVPFVKEFRRLLLYKEFMPDEYQSVQMDPQFVQSPTTIKDKAGRSHLVPVVRLVILQFLDELQPYSELKQESVARGHELQSALDNLILDLLGLNCEQEFLKASPLGSDKHGEKLRAWQALCILSKHVGVETLPNVVALVFKVLKQSVAHSIRVHMEIFLASILIRFPDDILTPLLVEFNDYNHSQQVLGSLFITLGHASESTDFFKTRIGLKFVPQVLSAIYPWLLCSPGLPRTIAQLIVYRLFPLLDSSDTYYESFKCLSLFLQDNMETSKMRERQIRFFREYNFQDKCTLRGLLALRKDREDISDIGGVLYAPSSEDIVPTHLLQVITEFLKESATNDYHQSLRGRLVALNSESDDIGTLQTKRIPLADLKLSLQQEDGGSARAGAGTLRRQDIIVCASLVSKPSNLGGLARTCEIFAVEKLILADLSITQGDVFQGIAVSSGSWLPMEEVPERELLSFLKDCKRCGYAIIGLEQTDSSQSLQSCELPSKCVLLLGKEREGIPVDLLNEVDICVEIPQFGVTRSLNVHVSASLALWEITAQNVDFINDGCRVTHGRRF